MNDKVKEVFAISNPKEGEKAIWSKIGVAFVCKDESINVILDAVPLTGKINIRDRYKKNGDNGKQESPAMF
ncbi:MAG: hypothetical protein ABII18_11805 [bacterium]|nr:hypothetical protein [bacterium]MBU1916633.1 hypothetical protein [bacterium]